MANLEKRNGIWYIRYTDFTGKRKYKSCGKKSTKVEAQQLLAQYAQKESDIRSFKKECKNSNLEPSQFDLYLLLNEFIQDHLPIGSRGLNKSPNTYKRECNAIGNFITFLKAKKVVNIEEIDDTLVINYLFIRQNRDKRAPKTLCLCNQERYCSQESL